jgi:hypothetical protein
MTDSRESGRALAAAVRQAAWAVVRYTLEGLAASGTTCFVPGDGWPADQRAGATDAPAPVIVLTRAERRQWASLVKRLR